MRGGGSILIKVILAALEQVARHVRHVELIYGASLLVELIVQDVVVVEGALGEPIVHLAERTNLLVKRVIDLVIQEAHLALLADLRALAQRDVRSALFRGEHRASLPDSLRKLASVADHGRAGARDLRFDFQSADIFHGTIHVVVPSDGVSLFVLIWILHSIAESPIATIDTRSCHAENLVLVARRAARDALPVHPVIVVIVLTVHAASSLPLTRDNVALRLVKLADASVQE